MAKCSLGNARCKNTDTESSALNTARRGVGSGRRQAAGAAGNASPTREKPGRRLSGWLRASPAVAAEPLTGRSESSSPDGGRILDTSFITRSNSAAVRRTIPAAWLLWSVVFRGFSHQHQVNAGAVPLQTGHGPRAISHFPCAILTT